MTAQTIDRRHSPRTQFPNPTAPSSFIESRLREIRQASTNRSTRSQSLNSTLVPVEIELLKKKLAALFRAANSEIFEDGMDSEFSQGLTDALEEYDFLMISELRELVLSGTLNAEVVAETLRWIGRIRHPTTCRQRLALLIQCLESASPQIRDGAALGLASLNDRSAAAALQAAAARETIRELREGIMQVLGELGTSNLWPST